MPHKHAHKHTNRTQVDTERERLSGAFKLEGGLISSHRMYSIKKKLFKLKKLFKNYLVYFKNECLTSII